MEAFWEIACVVDENPDVNGDPAVETFWDDHPELLVDYNGGNHTTSECRCMNCNAFFTEPSSLARHQAVINAKQRTITYTKPCTRTSPGRTTRAEKHLIH